MRWDSAIKLLIAGDKALGYYEQASQAVSGAKSVRNGAIELLGVIRTLKKG